MLLANSVIQIFFQLEAIQCLQDLKMPMNCKFMEVISNYLCELGIEVEY